jgi:hypothetical protein
MPKRIQAPKDKYKRELIARINYNCDIRGITREHLQIYVRCSRATLCRRISDPGTFTLDELIRLADKLNIPIWELLKPDDK